MKLNVRIVLLVLVSVIIISCQSLPKGVSSVMATWLYGYHTLPSTVTISGNVESFRSSPEAPPWTKLAAKELKSGIKLPVVLYMHGCKGIISETEQYRRLLLSQGYGVFIPDSFKRLGRQACRDEGSLSHRVSLRLEEVEYALIKIRELPWVDQNQVILMGFSEGGNTVDNWSKKGFSAHIIVGSACTLSGGTPAAPNGVPVLAVVGGSEPIRPGRSCTIQRTIGGSKSVVIPGAGHRISGYAETQSSIKSFLRQCCSLNN